MYIYKKEIVKFMFCLHMFFIFIPNKDIDECASNPYENNGTCFDLVNGYYCMCVPGYTDAQCSTGKM